MMPVEVIVAIVGAIEAIGVAIIGAIVAAQNRRSEQYRQKREAEEAAEREEREERERLRLERDTCLYELVFATARGSEVLLHQAHGDRLNGNVDEALSSLREAMADCNRTFNRQAAKLG